MSFLSTLKAWSPWHLRATVLHYQEKVKDIEDFGTRCDLNPTKRVETDYIKNESWWHGYITMMSDAVKSRAHGILNDAPVKIPAKMLDPHS